MPYTSNVFTVDGTTLSNTTKTATYQRFISAMHAANLFLAKPSKRNCSIAAVTAQLGVGMKVAAEQVAATTNVLTGETAEVLYKNFSVSRIGLLNVIDLRSQFGGFNVPSGFGFADAIVPGAGKLVDYSVLEKALKGKRRVIPACNK